MAKAYSGPVELNGYRYAVRGPIYKQRVIEWPEAQPPETTQQRTTRRYLQSWNIEGARGMLAYNDFDGNLQMCWDSTIETRFPGQLTLPVQWIVGATGYPLTKEDNGDGIMDDIRGPATVWGQTYLAYGKLNGSNHSLYVGQVSSFSIGNYEIVTPDASNAFVPTDICAHEEMLFVVYKYNLGWHLQRKIYGASWQDIPNYSGQWDSQLFNSGDWGLLASVNERLFFVYWSTVNKTLSTQFSLDGGIEWSALTEISTCAWPPHKAMAWSDADGNARLTICTPFGVLQTDADGLNPRWLLHNVGNYETWSGRGALVWPTTGALYYPYGGAHGAWWMGTSGQAGRLTELYWQNGALVQHEVGVDQGARMPPGRSGPIQFLQASDRWLFALMSTGTASNATRYQILAYDGVGWHHVYDSDYSPGDFNSAGDKGLLIALNTIDQMQFVWDETGSSTTVDAIACVGVLDNPWNPIWSPQYKAVEGYIEFAVFGGNQPEIDTVWLAARVIADQLTSTETIVCKYKLDDAGSWTTLGTFNDSTTELQFGSGAGVSGKRIKIRLEMARTAGSALVTPVLFNLCIEYLKVPPARHYYRFLIDVTETARANGQTPKDVRKRLEAAETSIAQVTLTVGGDTQTYVKLVEPTPTIAAEFPEVPNPLETQLSGPETIEVVALELV